MSLVHSELHLLKSWISASERVGKTCSLLSWKTKDSPPVFLQDHPRNQTTETTATLNPFWAGVFGVRQSHGCGGGRRQARGASHHVQVLHPAALQRGAPPPGSV